MSIQLRITDNAAEVLARVKNFPQVMGKSIAAALDHENELTIGYIQAKKLSRRGPETLGVITNRLRSSVNRSLAVVSGNTVTSAIGSNVVYAAAHEFGFKGTVQVKAHKRRIIAFDRYERVGKRLVQTQSGIKGTIRAHAMRMNIPARAPFRKGIEDRMKNYTASISFAIVSGWENPQP